MKFSLARPTPASSSVHVSREDSHDLRTLLRRETGIHLTEEKVALIESRLGGRLRELQLDSYAAYRNYLARHPEEVIEFVNALTTNKTDFFREPDHFEFLTKNVVPGLAHELAERPLFVWSAACSTGEEPYTIAMSLSQMASNVDYRILGSDIDTRVLKQAAEGRYRARTVTEQVRPDFVQRYFQHDPSGDLLVTEDLRERMKFRRHNLVSESLATPIKFDVIFLRNVLFYFSIDTVQSVIDTIVDRLRPQGYLFIGHAESLVGIVHPLRLVRTSVFQKGSSK